MTASSYQTASCSHCLCTTNEGACTKGRCCCRDIARTNISYSCPDYFDGEKILVTGISTHCGCIPCGDFGVSFIVQAVKRSDVPIPLANVTVDLTHTYLTDETGHVGFLVPASHTMVQIDIHAACYADFSQNYFVIPGQVNILKIVLTEIKTLTMLPPQLPFLLHTQSLTVVPLPIGTLFVNQVLDSSFLPLLPSTESTINTYLYFPGGVFPLGELYTFLTSGRHLDSNQDLESLHFSFTTLRPLDGERILLYAVAMGDIEIVDDLGHPFVPEVTGSNITDMFGLVTVTQTNHHPVPATNEGLHPFVLDNSTGSVFELMSDVVLLADTSEDTPGQQVIAFSLLGSSQLVSPLHYIIALEEVESCYLAVRANDPVRILHNNLIKLSTTIIAISRMESLTDGIVGTYVSVGHIDSCMTVPCQGDALIKLMGKDIAFDRYLENIEHSSHVYDNITECIRIGLEDNTQTNRYVELDLASSYCEVSYPFHSSLLTHTSPLPLPQQEMINEVRTQFCSVRVAIATCLGRSAQVVTMYESEMRIIQVSSLIEPDYIVTEAGSGSGMGDDYGNESDPCNYIQYLCLLIPCGVTVGIEVTQSQGDTINGTIIYSEQCAGHSNTNVLNADSDLKLLENIGGVSGSFVFQSSGGEVGVHSSESTEDVAIEKCSQSSDIGVHFQCYVP